MLDGQRAVGKLRHARAARRRRARLRPAPSASSSAGNGMSGSAARNRSTGGSPDNPCSSRYADDGRARPGSRCAAGAFAAFSVPARSTQSRLRITSALRERCKSFRHPAAACRARRHAADDRSESDAPIFRSVTTRALSASASATRAFQASTLRETRPARITGVLRRAAACPRPARTSSARARSRPCGMKRAGVDRRQRLGQVSPPACSASRLT